MSFIQDESKQSSYIWDLVIILALVLGGLGVWYYYQSSKKSSHQAFAHAERLYKEKKYDSALVAFEKLKELDYLDAHQDSLLFTRLDFLLDYKESHGQ